MRRLWSVSVDVASLIPSDQEGITISARYGHGSDIATDSIVRIKDTQTPTLTLTAPAAINLANQGAYPVSGTCNKNDSEVSVVLESLPVVEAICDGSAWSMNVDVGSLTVSSVAISVSLMDRVGNAAQPTSGTAVRDVEAPQVGHYVCSRDHSRQ